MEREQEGKKQSIWNENALDFQEETENKRQQFVREVAQNKQGIAADREKFIHKGKTGSHKVFQERG